MSCYCREDLWVGTSDEDEGDVGVPSPLGRRKRWERGQLSVRLLFPFLWIRVPSIRKTRQRGVGEARVVGALASRSLASPSLCCSEVSVHTPQNSGEC